LLSGDRPKIAKQPFGAFSADTSFDSPSSICELALHTPCRGGAPGPRGGARMPTYAVPMVAGFTSTCPEKQTRGRSAPARLALQRAFLRSTMLGPEARVQFGSVRVPARACHTSQQVDTPSAWRVCCARTAGVAVSRPQGASHTAARFGTQRRSVASTSVLALDWPETAPTSSPMH